MLWNAVKWDEWQWALVATGREVAPFQLGTGTPSWYNLKQTDFLVDPMRADT